MQNYSIMIQNKSNEFTARIDDISANGIVKIKFSKQLIDQEDGFDVSLINATSF